MGPLGRPSNSGSRLTMVSMSRMVIGLLCMLALLPSYIYGYSRVFGLESSTKMEGLHSIGLFVTIPVAMVIALAISGWVWGFLGKTLCGFTRQEVEAMVTPVLPNPLLVRYKNWYLNVLFGPKTSPTVRHGGTPGQPVLGTTDGPERVQSVLYECSAAGITKNWDDQTTKTFNMAMARTEWWPHTRGVLRFMHDAITFDDWRVPYAEIDDAVVTTLSGIFPGYYLRIRANGQPYQFSILSWNPAYFRYELPFPVRRASAKGITWFFLLVRLLPIVALLAYFLWTTRK
jgi:hypothetical protein